MKIFLIKKPFNFIIFISIILLICPLIFITYKSNYDIKFYISTYGNDDSKGNKTHPFRTLEGARNTIRKINKNKKYHKNIIVFLRGGNYFINKSFTLEKSDTANNSLSITYKSYKAEKVYFIGGYNLPSTSFKPVYDMNVLNEFVNKVSSKNILVADLSKYPMNFNSTTQNISKAPELFYNNNPMTLAQFPNNSYLTIGQVLNNNNAGLYSLKYNGSQPSLWHKNQNIWMSGYWYYNWNYSTVKASNIDIISHLIYFTDKVPFGIKKGQRFYLYNILEELDNPREYYIDYDKKLLYFFPNTSINNSKIQLSQLTEPFIKIKDTSNVSIEGITFENSRANSIVIENGTNDKIKNCIIRNTSQNGISIYGGINNGIENCKIYNTGTGALLISGGNRNTLTHCNNYTTNNEIYNYSRIKKTYSAAINISGVGISVSHNSIHDASHTAILFSGNDHLLEYNEIYNVATETSDVGAIYTGRDWTYRGNIIRYNYLHNIDNNIDNSNVSGVYLDDCMSSAEIYGNIFYKVKNPIFIGGGRDNIIENNIIVNCKNSINFDARGLIWSNLGPLYTNLKKVPYENIIWSNKYPELKNILKNGTPGTPNNNVIKNNVLYQTKTTSINEYVVKYGTVKSNISFKVNPGFINLGKTNFGLNKSSIIFKQLKGFKNIDFNNIGRKTIVYPY